MAAEVNRHLVNIFVPFQLVLTFLGKLRFHYDGRRLRAPTTYNTYILFTVLSITSLYLYSIAMLYNEAFLVNYLLLTTAYFFIFITTSGHVLLSNRNGDIIRLLVLLDSLERHMRLPAAARQHYHVHARRNVTVIMCTLVFHFVLLVMEIALMHKFQYFSAFICLTRMAIDFELIYYLSYVTLICDRLHYFNKNILKMANRSDVDVVASYKKIVHIIKWLNEIWRFQLMMLFAGEFYLVSRSMTLQLRYYKSIHEVKVQHQFIMNCIFLIRHLLSFYLPSHCGQQLANMLNETKLYCAKQRFSNESVLKRNVAVHILSLHKVYKPGLHIAKFDALKIDGKWPLTVLAAFAASIVVMLGLER